MTSTVKAALRQVVPAGLWRRVRSASYTVRGTRRMAAEDRVAAIAALAGPIIRREPGWQALFYALERAGLHAMPVHFHSAAPDTRELAAHRHRWDRPSDFSTVRYDRSAEAALNAELARFAPEFDGMPTATELQAKGLGPGYGEIEALLLHAMVRHLKPRRVIEVGSGVSTYYAAHALRLNGGEGAPGRITCIEPYPSDHLRRADFAPELIVEMVQDVDPATFGQLAAGDVLFIDSSHMVKIGSDVNFLLLDVLPALAAGVLVHVHDIPFPFVTNRDYWVFEKAIFWQEAVLLKALLTHSDAFEIAYCCSYLAHDDPAALKRTFPSYDPAVHRPSSVWLRKLR